MKRNAFKNHLPLYGILLLPLLLISCSGKKLQQHEEWAGFFKNNQVDGCILWHNYYDGTFDVYHYEQVRKRVLPAETFDLVMALAGLETGAIRDTNMILPDSVSGPELSGITMAEAFRNNITPYFQKIATKIGEKRIRYWLDSTYYGNKEIGNDLTAFWMDNTLQISPDEQVGLLERLYQGRFAYQSRTQRLVKNLLIKKISHSDTLYYKQGIGEAKNRKIGWLIGWLMKKDDPYFFAIRTEASDSIANLRDKQINILYKVLRAKGMVTESGHLN